MARLQTLVLVGSLAAACLASPAHGRDRPESGSPHDAPYRLPQVRSLAFSPDGRRLVASYFVYAFNRPGTDWGAWTAQWDIATGKRLVIPGTYHPVAFRSDGRLMAIGVYGRSGQRGQGMLPLTRLALWRPGANLAQRELKPPKGDDSPVVAATFNLDGKRVLAMTAGGSLLSWDVTKEAPARILDKLDEGVRLSQRRGTVLPTMGLSPRGELLASFPAVAGGSAVLWRYLPSSAAPDGYVLERRRSYGGGLITWNASAVRFLGFSGRTRWAYPFALSEAGRQKDWRLGRLWEHVDFCPDGRTLGFSAKGKVSVNLWTGVHVRTFPAGGSAVAFSPDGKRLAAADTRGIIRIWEIATGRLVQTLRLDDRPPNTVLVAAVQCHSSFGEPAANRKKLTRLVRRAVSRGAKIVVLPETAVTGYLSADLKKTWQVGDRPISAGLEGVDPKDAAETVPGPATQAFSKLADEFGLYLTVPLLEADRKTGRYYNTSVLLGPDGRMLLHYRKRDPWAWAERGWAAPGDRGNPVVDTPFGRLGLLVCYDIHAQAKVMGELKVDTLLYSIAWVEDKGSDWFAKQLPAIARRHGFNVVAANWTVPKDPAPKWHGYGQSRILDAAGKVLAKVTDDLGEEIIYAELPIPATLPSQPTPERSK